MKRYLSMLLSAVICAGVPLWAFAGGSVGNGGDGIVCRSGTKPEVETLDLYEARTMRGITAELGGPQLSWRDKLDIALTRLEKIDHFRAAHYQDRLNTFLSEASFIPGIKLIDIPDSQQVILPSQCTIEQVAIQKPPQFPGDAYYVVNKDLWDLMSTDNQAALVLHEIVYREAIEFGHQNSISARYFNSLVLSNRFDKIALNDYIHLLYRLPFGTATVRGVEAALFVPTSGGGLNFSESLEDQFNPNVLPESLYVYRDSRLQVSSNWLNVAGNSQISFFSNGNVKSAAVVLGQWSQNQNTYFLSGNTKFFDNGRLDAIHLAQPQIVSLPKRSASLSVESGSGVTFFASNGDIKEIDHVRDGSIQQNGITYTNLYGAISFYESQIINYLSTKTSVAVTTPWLSLQTLPQTPIFFYPNGEYNSMTVQTGKAHLANQKPGQFFNLAPKETLVLNPNKSVNTLRVTQGDLELDGIQYSLVSVSTEIQINGAGVVLSLSMANGEFTLKQQAISLSTRGKMDYVLTTSGNRTFYKYKYGYITGVNLLVAGVQLPVNEMDSFSFSPDSVSIKLSRQNDAVREDGSPYELHGYVELSGVISPPTGYKFVRCSDEIRFYNNGKIQYCAVIYNPRGKPFPVTMLTPQGPRDFAVEWNYSPQHQFPEFFFFDNGQVKKGTLGRQATFIDVNGATVIKNADEVVEFDGNGKLLR